MWREDIDSAEQAVVVRRLTETRALLDAAVLRSKAGVLAWVRHETWDSWAVLVFARDLETARQHLKLPTEGQR